MQNFKLKLIEPKEQVKETPKKEKVTSILDARFAYTPSAETDLASRFKAMGFKAKPKKPRFGR
jgi:hypothetical protein